MSENREEEQPNEQDLAQEDSTSEPAQVEYCSSSDRNESEATAVAEEQKQIPSADKPAEESVHPPKKRMKMAAKKSSNAAEPSTSPIPNDPFPYARLRGIRIFSEREIEAQDAEMTKSYWRFWNRTAEELCSDRAYNDWGKRDLKLYIDAAWIIHKTYLQELTERQLGENLKELQEKYGYVEIPPKIKTQDEGVTSSLSKLQDSTANLNQLNLDLAKCRGKFVNLKQRPVTSSYNKTQKQEDEHKMSKEVSEHEKNLYDGMSEVKRDQDSLKKALNKLKNLIFKARNTRPPPAVVQSSAT